ncbi:MAG: hypothetical protein WAU60_17140 [Candidatus Competibacter denitrificans]|jgi:hypothetical protein
MAKKTNRQARPHRPGLVRTVHLTVGQVLARQGQRARWNREQRRVELVDR